MTPKYSVSALRFADRVTVSAVLTKLVELQLDALKLSTALDIISLAELVTDQLPTSQMRQLRAFRKRALETIRRATTNSQWHEFLLELGSIPACRVPESVRLVVHQESSGKKGLSRVERTLLQTTLSSLELGWSRAAPEPIRFQQDLLASQGSEYGKGRTGRPGEGGLQQESIDRRRIRWLRDRVLTELGRSDHPCSVATLTFCCRGGDCPYDDLERHEVQAVLIELMRERQVRSRPGLQKGPLWFLHSHTRRQLSRPSRRVDG